MNISEDITIKKSNKTNKNIFTVTKILNLRHLDLIWSVCIFSINYSNNREIKINLAPLHTFILQCFPNYKNGYLGRLICHFWHLHQTTRKYTFQTFTSFHLTHYKCPEHFHDEILEIDASIPDTLVSAILILPVTLAPLTGFLASKRQDICATKTRVLLLSVRVISNHPIINYCLQIFRRVLVWRFVFFLVFCKRLSE